MSPIRRRTAVLLVPLAILLVGCGPQPNDGGCGTAAPQLVNQISGQVHTGALRNARTFSPSGAAYTFLSIERRTDVQVKENKDGDILTFAIPSSGSTVLAVDERARKSSTFAAAPFTVTQQGAIESRGCVFSARKKKK